jgi:hypothetical protein
MGNSTNLLEAIQGLDDDDFSALKAIVELQGPNDQRHTRQMLANATAGVFLAPDNGALRELLGKLQLGTTQGGMGGGGMGGGGMGGSFSLDLALSQLSEAEALEPFIEFVLKYHYLNETAPADVESLPVGGTLMNEPTAA